MDTQQLRTKYKSLPPEVRDALSQESVPSSVLAIAKQLTLDRNKIYILSEAIAGYVTKSLTPAEFVEYIKNGLGVSYEKARAIAGHIKRDALSPAQSHLESIGLNIDDIPSD